MSWVTAMLYGISWYIRARYYDASVVDASVVIMSPAWGQWVILTDRVPCKFAILSANLINGMPSDQETHLLYNIDRNLMKPCVANYSLSNTT